MYYSFFGLKEKPFNVTPDPRFLFLSKYHQEALSHLLYGIEERKGFIEITGEVGTGKTILCRTLLNQVGKNVHTALIFNSYLSEIELLQNINADFGLAGAGMTRKELIDELNQFLIQQFTAGKNAVLVIDEAQNLDPPVLEQMRMLSNLETDSGKLLQIVLVGQPELRELLSRPDLRQLDQRITVRYHIKPLDRSDTEKYIYHRLLVAGSRGELEFSKKAFDAIYRHSEGVPRRINIFCDRALLHAYAAGQRKIDSDIIRRAAEEIDGQRQVKRAKPHESVRTTGWFRPFWKGVCAGGALLLLLVIVAYVLLSFSSFPWSIPWFTTIATSPVNPADSPLPSLATPSTVPSQIPEAVSTEAKPPEQATPLSVASQTISNTPEVVTADGLAFVEQYRSKIQEIIKRYGNLTPQSVSTIFNADFSTTWLHFDRLRAFKVPFLVEVFPTDPTQAETFFILAAKQDEVLVFDNRGEERTFDRKSFNAIWYGKTYLLYPRGVDNVRILREGSSGADVRKMQENLSLLGYYKAKPTGQFDVQTRNAVRYFQRDYNLQVDGHVGPETRLILYYVTGPTTLE